VNIYLVRHTHYANPENIYAFRLPLRLSQEGEQHAQRIGKWFAENKLQKLPIYTSPITRCIQTAEIIAAYTGSTVKTDERLIEVFAPSLQGKPQPAETPWKVEEDDASRESRQSILRRILNIYNEKATQGNDCILVSHGEPLTVLYHYLSSERLPKYLWGPENNENIINRGEIVRIELKNNRIRSTSRIKV